jgi:hypothetical protein
MAMLLVVRGHSVAGQPTLAGSSLSPVRAPLAQVGTMMRHVILLGALLAVARGASPTTNAV